jgi:hypothetical protein
MVTAMTWSLGRNRQALGIGGEAILGVDFPALSEPPSSARFEPEVSKHRVQGPKLSTRGRIPPGTNAAPDEVQNDGQDKDADDRHERRRLGS